MMSTLRVVGLLAAGALASCAVNVPIMTPATPAAAAAPSMQAFFRDAGKTVLTFAGYSGAGYEDPAAMRAAAQRVLDEFDPARTLVNIGATEEGIGAVYELAKRRGFVTTGIVSTQARESKTPLSPHVDHVFFVEDASWGGLQEDGKLSPTSQAMVDHSSVMVAIGGGEVARDEMRAARRAGKPVRFIPADMNHRQALETAQRKGQPAPQDFRGAAHAAF